MPFAPRPRVESPESLHEELLGLRSRGPGLEQERVARALPPQDPVLVRGDEASVDLLPAASGTLVQAGSQCRGRSGRGEIGEFAQVVSQSGLVDVGEREPCGRGASLFPQHRVDRLRFARQHEHDHDLFRLGQELDRSRGLADQLGAHLRGGGDEHHLRFGVEHARAGFLDEVHSGRASSEECQAQVDFPRELRELLGMGAHDDAAMGGVEAIEEARPAGQEVELAFRGRARGVGQEPRRIACGGGAIGRVAVDEGAHERTEGPGERARIEGHRLPERGLGKAARRRRARGMGQRQSQHRAEREQIRRGPVRLTQEDLGGDVIAGAGDALGPLVGPGDQVEVHQHRALVHDQDVVRLEVAVHQALAVQGLEVGQQLAHPAHEGCGARLPGGAIERVALQIGAGHVGRPLVQPTPVLGTSEARSTQARVAADVPGPSGPRATPA